MTNSLISFWRKFEDRGPPYIHPEDAKYIVGKKVKGSSGNAQFVDSSYVYNDSGDFRSYLKSEAFGKAGDTRFHTSLLPSPYCGNLKTAKVFVLLLNPGLSYTDYYGECAVANHAGFNPEYLRSRLLDTLRQSNGTTEFPFMWLDPELCWHTGFVWWERKLRPIAELVAEKKGMGYLETLKWLSDRIASIELFPYHSKNSPNSRTLQNLPSVRRAKEFVKEELVPRAKSEEILIVCLRRSEDWGVSNNKRDNMIAPKAKYARSGSLSPYAKQISSQLLRTI